MLKDFSNTNEPSDSPSKGYNMRSDPGTTVDRASTALSAPRVGTSLLHQLRLPEANSRKSDMASRITFNGQEYASLDDMPAEVRRAYEQVMAAIGDSDRDRTLGILERVGQVNIRAAMHTRIIVNGQEYSSVDEMPADVRETYEQMMAKFDADRNGVPDMLEDGGPSGLPKVDWNWSVNARVDSPAGLPDVMRSASLDPKPLLAGAVIVFLVIAALLVWTTSELFSALR